MSPIATIATAERRQARERFFIPATAPTHEGDVVANTRNPTAHAWHRTEAVGLGPTALRVGRDP